MSKLSEWYDSLPEQTKTYLKNQPLYKEKDLYKSLAIGAVVGFVVGFILGYQAAWKPLITTFRPLIG